MKQRCKVYAHRGASDYATENTMSAFFLALEMGADAIETDVSQTGDGVLVLFHDPTPERLCGILAPVSQMRYEDLAAIDLGAYKNAKYAGEPAVRLEDFLRYFKKRPLTLAIELKQPGVARAAMGMIAAFGCLAQCEITSFHLEELKAALDVCPEASCGWLCPAITQEALDALKRLGIRQICPKAEGLAPETVQLAHGQGFSVRAWGVKTQEHMMHALSCGVDGMTVNDPLALMRALS